MADSRQLVLGIDVGGTKVLGMDIFGQSFGFSMAETMAFGDGGNDIREVETMGSNAGEFLICVWKCIGSTVKDSLSELSTAVSGDDTICTDTAGTGRICREGKSSCFFGTAL